MEDGRKFAPADPICREAAPTMLPSPTATFIPATVKFSNFTARNFRIEDTISLWINYAEETEFEANCAEFSIFSALISDFNLLEIWISYQEYTNRSEPAVLIIQKIFEKYLRGNISE